MTAPAAYTATVTPAEQLVGRRPLQLSLNEDGTALAQPRLVTDGDVKGGRYVSGVVDIYVGHRARELGSPARTHVSASVRTLTAARFPARPAPR